jgi:hypothetical protein
MYIITRKVYIIFVIRSYDCGIRNDHGLHATEIILRRAKKNGPAPAERGRAHGKKLMLALRKKTL